MTVGDLLAALDSADDAHKYTLIRRLGDAGDAAAVPALSAIVRDPSARIDLRRLAAQALGKIGDTRGCMALIAVLSQPPQPDRRLIPRLQQLYAEFEQQAHQPGLNEAQHKVLNQKLAEVDATIAHEGDRVRLLKITAVEALGRIGYVLALTPLEDIIQADNDADLSSAAEIALAQVREKSGLKSEDEAAEVEAPEPAVDYQEVLVCAKCGTTSATGDVRRCQNCRLPVCEQHSIREVGLVFCSQTCLDSFASQPGNWEYWT